MNKFIDYNMWWCQSLSSQALRYTNWKKTTHIFKGRTHMEATRKMNKFLSFAKITGRFFCVEPGFTPEHIKKIIT